MKKTIYLFRASIILLNLCVGCMQEKEKTSKYLPSEIRDYPEDNIYQIPYDSTKMVDLYDEEIQLILLR